MQTSEMTIIATTIRTSKVWRVVIKRENKPTNKQDICKQCYWILEPREADGNVETFLQTVQRNPLLNRRGFYGSGLRSQMKQKQL